MGLFDQLAGAALGALSNNANGDSKAGIALQLVTGLLQNQEGGLSGLVKSLSEKGLGEQVKSWVGTGENQAVDPNQLISALSNNETFNTLVSKTGLSTEQASQILATALPIAIDKLTPNGQVEEDPSNNLMQAGLSSLMNLFNKS